MTPEQEKDTTSLQALREEMQMRMKITNRYYNALLEIAKGRDAAAQIAIRALNQRD